MMSKPALVLCYHSTNVNGHDYAANDHVALRADLNAPAVLDLVDEWAASEGDDSAAAAEVAQAVDALLGVRL